LAAAKYFTDSYSAERVAVGGNRKIDEKGSHAAGRSYFCHIPSLIYGCLGPAVISPSMSKSIVVKISQTPETLFAKAQQAAIEQGYKLVGDASKGLISGSGVRGSYKFSGSNVLILNIQDKPTLLSWKTVEEKLLSFLAQ